MININEKNFSNYQPEFTGRGLRIAFVEYNASEWFANKNIGNPLNHPTTSLFGEDDGKLTHSYKCACVIRDLLPEATIDFLPQTNEGFNYILNNNYHIVSASIGNALADDSIEKKVAQKTFMIISAGNEGANGENISARNDWWYPVTAFHLNGNIVSYPSYASYGYNKVKCGSFANIQYEENSNFEMGTSVSQPFFVGLLGKYYQAYKMKLGFYPTIQEVKDFISENCHPILNEPLKEGMGLFVLPNLSTYNFGMSVRLNSTEVNNNGVITNTVNPMQLINNKTMVELTVLRNLGLTVYWDAVNNRAIVK